MSLLGLLTKFTVLKRSELRPNKNNELFSLVYLKHPKTTFFGCLSSS